MAAKLHGCMFHDLELRQTIGWLHGLAIRKKFGVRSLPHDWFEMVQGCSNQRLNRKASLEGLKKGA